MMKYEYFSGKNITVLILKSLGLLYRLEDGDICINRISLSTCTYIPCPRGAAVHDRQRRRGLAHRHDLVAHLAHPPGGGSVLHPPLPWGVLLPVGDQAAQPRQPHRLALRARGRDAVAAHVPAPLPHLPRDAAPQ
ncbi:hypothetical protein CEXT_522511 [Caerostris extrusa]|uniref:Uncharacterized protein n=1 Tax=Caerostris extrusa TaxID=172846 RepID=A0AAV4P409_CAEEX|nr:hypothetical protein CEXT_522511 [Caerostris extrusa]